MTEDAYHFENPYHNSTHATDVLQALHCLLQEEVCMHACVCMRVCMCVWVHACVHVRVCAANFAFCCQQSLLSAKHHHSLLLCRFLYVWLAEKCLQPCWLPSFMMLTIQVRRCKTTRGNPQSSMNEVSIYETFVLCSVKIIPLRCQSGLPNKDIQLPCFHTRSKLLHC